MKRFLAIMLAAVLLLSVTSCGKTYKSTFTSYEGEKIYVEMVVKDYGLMTIELYPDVAPITVRNFATLVSESNSASQALVVAKMERRGEDGLGVGSW